MHLERDMVRCKDYNPWYKSLVKSGLSMAKVLASPRVTAEEFETRMRACMVCEFSLVADGGAHIFCECCGCPRWRGATLAVKNSHEAHIRPRDPPGFPPLSMIGADAMSD